MLSFRLTIPNVGSWNRQWSGSEDKFYIIKRVSTNKVKELESKNFYYDFGDGWGANIKVEKIDKDKWFFKMMWCRKQGVAPADNFWWEQAEEALKNLRRDKRKLCKIKSLK